MYSLPKLRIMIRIYLTVIVYPLNLESTKEIDVMYSQPRNVTPTLYTQCGRLSRAGETL